MNGVRMDRGGRWGLGSDYLRCGGIRDKSTQSGTGGGYLGFRFLVCEW